MPASGCASIRDKKLYSVQIYIVLHSSLPEFRLDNISLQDYCMPHIAETLYCHATISQLIAQLLSERGVFDKGLKFRSMTLPDKFIDQDSPESMYKKAGLDNLSIVNKVEDVLKSNIILAQNKTKNLN